MIRPSLALLMALALVGCDDRSGREGLATKTESAVAQGPGQGNGLGRGQGECGGEGECAGRAAAGKRAGACAGGPTGEGDQHKAGESCGGLCGETAGAIQDASERAVTRADGKTGRAAGQKLAGADAVKVIQLLDKSVEFAGKTVRLEGDVTGMCRRKRGWFAMQDPGEREARGVRILTAPRFLVPADAVGTRAQVEGVVDILERPAPGGGTRQIVVVRATGAEFY